MELFVEALDREVAELHQNGVRLRFIGDRRNLPVRLQARIAAAEERTAGNRAARPAGRGELRRPLGHRAGGARTCTRVCERGAASPRRSTRRLSRRGSRSPGLPDPDLFIRTGGEQRISNFLLWNLAYTELYFTDALWPDFDDADLEAALALLREPRAALRPAAGGGGERLIVNDSLRQRVITAVVLAVALLVILLWLPPVATVIALTALLLAGAWEWSAFLRLSAATRPHRLCRVRGAAAAARVARRRRSRRPRPDPARRGAVVARGLPLDRLRAAARQALGRGRRRGTGARAARGSRWCTCASRRRRMANGCCSRSCWSGRPTSAPISPDGASGACASRRVVSPGQDLGGRARRDGSERPRRGRREPVVPRLARRVPAAVPRGGRLLGGRRPHREHVQALRGPQGQRADLFPGTAACSIASTASRRRRRCCCSG